MATLLKMVLENPNYKKREVKMIEKIKQKYARRFANFRKKRWYIDWLFELSSFLKEIEKAKKRG